MYRYEGNLNGIENAIVLFQLSKSIWKPESTKGLPFAWMSLSTK